MKSNKCGPTGYTRIEIFSKASFYSIFITSHIGTYFLFTQKLTFCLPPNYINILFVYLVTRRDGRGRRDGI
jgi:hypothetical protein